MTGNFNQWIGLGRITSDPKKVGENGPVTASIAVNRKFTVNDEPKEEVLFLKLVMWSKLAMFASEHLSKGDTVQIVGKLKNEEWTKEGVKMSSISCHVDNLQLISRRDSEDLSSKRP